MKYLNTNTKAKVGDIVLITHAKKNDFECKILKIILPNTVDDEDWAAPNGGVLIEFDTGGLMLLSYLDEDIEFIRRGKI